jgi:hypothetical protein
MVHCYQDKEDVMTPADDDLLRGFATGELPGLAHADHVRVAWLYVRRDGMPQALVRFAADLRRFAQAKGSPDLYHETITWAYLFLVAERCRLAPQVDRWSDFAARFPELLQWKPSLLDRLYTPETLWSEQARRGFVMPDRGLAERAA